MFKKTLIAVAATSLVVLPLLVFAQAIPTAPTNLSSVGGIIRLLNIIVGWFQRIVFIVAIIMILYAGFLFLTAAGNEEKVASARSTLLWGLVGIAVALVAGIAADFVASFLGGK